MARAAGVFAVFTLLSRILGLVREQTFAALVGAGAAADAFVVAFRIPNLLRDLFAEGALSAAFVPTFTDVWRNRSPAEAWDLANRVMNTVVVILGACVVLGWLATDALVGVVAGNFDPEHVALTARLTRIMMPFLPTVSLAAVAMGMLTAQKRFGPPALAPTLFNAVSIAVGAALYMGGADPVTAVTGWAVGTLLGGVAQFLVQIPSLRSAGYRYRWTVDWRFEDPGLRRIARLMGPATVGLAATNLNIIVNTTFASAVEGAAAWLSYAFRLMYLPIGVFGMAVAAVATAGMAEKAAARDMPGMDRTIGEGLRLVAFLTIPSMLALALLAEPIVRLLYERGRFSNDDTTATALCLMGYAAGLYSYAAVKVIAPAFYALDRTRMPLLASVSAVVLDIGLNAALFYPAQRTLGGPWAAGVLALGTSVAALVQLAVLLTAYGRVGGNLSGEKLGSHVLRVGASAAVAAGTGWAVARGLSTLLPTTTLLGRLVEVGGGLTALAVVYVLACQVTRVEELEMVRTRLMSRLRRRTRAGRPSAPTA